MRFDLRGSAACTIRLPVFAYDKNFMNSSALLRNDCPLDAKQGYADMAGVLLLFLLLFILGKAQDKAAEYLETQVIQAQKVKLHRVVLITVVANGNGARVVGVMCCIIDT